MKIGDFVRRVPYPTGGDGISNQSFENISLFKIYLITKVNNDTITIEVPTDDSILYETFWKGDFDIENFESGPKKDEKWTIGNYKGLIFLGVAQNKYLVFKDGNGFFIITKDEFDDKELKKLRE